MADEAESRIAFLKAAFARISAAPFDDRESLTKEFARACELALESAGVIFVEETEELSRRIDAWIAAQPEPRPSRPEAIRRLVDDEIELAIRADGAPRRPIPQPLGSLSLAQSYFEEPRWWLSLVLAWIAFREVEGITASYDDIRTLRFRVVMHGTNGDALKEKAPLSNLLKRLKAGRIVAIDGDDTDLPAEYWDRIRYGQPWQDWPHVRFRREHVLENWPKRSNQSDERYPGRPTVKPAILKKFRERVAAGTFEKTLAAESQWLFRWVENEFPGDSAIPSTPRSIENQIRKKYQEACGKHKPR